MPISVDARPTEAVPPPAMKPVRRTWRRNSRRYLSAAVGWSVFTLVAVAALVAAILAAGEAERHARADAADLLTELAAQSAEILAARLATHRSLVQATATQIAASNDRSTGSLRRHLDALRAQFPEFVWLGVADRGGNVLADTGGALHAANLSGRPWFAGSLAQPSVGARQAASFGTDSGQAALDAIVVAAPLPSSAAGGVVVGYLAWSWVEALQSDLLGILGPQRGLELLLSDAGGRVLAGPTAWIGRGAAAGTDLSESGAYLIGRANVGLGVDALPGWAETVREPARTALAPARAVQRNVFVVVLLAGLVAAAAAMLATRALMRRLTTLATQAEAVRLGAQGGLSAPAGEDDVSRIGAALAELVGQLQREKQALTTLNAELDARVADRAARIEKLAEEARHAAVMRERLRLARDLHDTLANSLMALLTQIRVIRKLHITLDAEAVDAELERAEELAGSGLTEARAAITQMRSTGVREVGLGVALRELLGRFGERTGIAVSVDADARAENLVGTRAEIAYRLTEEALHNVERHSGAQRVMLTLTECPSRDAASASAAGGDAAPACMELCLSDDGMGFDVASHRDGRFGLQGMREQADLIGAEFELSSEAGYGTHVRLRFEA